jgi:putative methyltransferase (TIGR04325 family)
MEAYPVLETYADYESALKHCGDGYGDHQLAEVTLAKTLAILSTDLKTALHPPNSDATLTAVQLVSAREPRVLDFGGSFGPHYFLAKQCLPKRYRWAVVETEAIAALGTEIANDELKFFTSIDAAREWLGQIDLVHASGSLQCTPRPTAVLSALVALRAPYLAVTRTAVAIGPECVTIQVSLLSGNGPVGGLPPGVEDRIVRYPRIFMAKDDFIATLGPHYRLVHQTLDDREPPLMADGVVLSLGDNFVFARRDVL